MSDKKNDFDLKKFIAIESATLKVGQLISFDCFVFLEKNNKILHWIREGTVFTVDRMAKLERIGRPQLLVQNFQKTAYLDYLKVHGLEAAELVTETGGSAPAKFVLIKGSKPTTSESDNSPATDLSSTGQNTFGVPSPVQKSEHKAPERVVQKTRIDVDFLNAVIKSTQQVFFENFLTEVKFRPPTKRLDKNPIPLNVASFIALTSQTIRGTIGLCFPSATYLFLLRQATGTPHETLNTELYTGCGEFIYNIFEKARPTLRDLGYTIDRAVPNIVVGENLSLTHIMPDPGFSIVFESPGGLFQFEIGIKTGG